MKPLRVAWLGHRSPVLGGGMATYSRETVHGLRERGVKVVFFHHSGSGHGPADPAPEADETVAVESHAIRKPLVFSPPGATRELAERLRRSRVDLVHASFWFSSLDFDLPRVCRRLGIPLIVTFHVAFDRRLSVWGGLTNAAYRVYARVLRRCTRVIVFGRAQADLLRELRVPEDVLVILPNGVDVQKYSPGESDARRRFGAERLFMYMGRVDAEKNVDVLLRAFTESLPAPGTKLVVIGTGTERRRLQRRFKRAPVIFTGHIQDEDERISILRGTDGFFLPSMVEGLSLSLLEAMACGAPVVATDVGSDGEALRGAGIVIDPQELEPQLTLALRLLTDVPELGPLLGRAARARAEERYSLAANLDRLVEVYREVTA